MQYFPKFCFMIPLYVPMILAWRARIIGAKCMADALADLAGSAGLLALCPWLLACWPCNLLIWLMGYWHGRFRAFGCCFAKFPGWKLIVCHCWAVWQKAPGDYSALFWTSNFSICLWERPKPIQFHDFGILGRVQEPQNHHYSSLETPGHSK